MTKMGAAITLERSQYPDRSLHVRVVHAIGRKILGGELPPGALLPAEPELGASRTVLREAIKVLTAKGLVEARPKIGTRVRPRDAWHLLDPDVLAWQQRGAGRPSLLRTLTDVRRIIEPAAAGLAASRADAGDLAALAEALDEMERTALLVSFRATSSLPGRASGSLPRHRAIFDAIRARDPRGAAAAMRHLVQVTAREIEAMGRRPRARRQGASRLGR